LQEGRFEELEGGSFRVNGHVLGPDEVLVERSGKEGWAVASDDGPDGRARDGARSRAAAGGRALDLIHAVNGMRREQGLALTDRIKLTIPTRTCSRSRSRSSARRWPSRSLAGSELRIEKA
jgi:hypothetical protein